MIDCNRALICHMTPTTYMYLSIQLYTLWYPKCLQANSSIILFSQIKYLFSASNLLCFRLSACSDALTSCEYGPLNLHAGVGKSVEDVLNIQKLICIIIQWNVTCIIIQNRAVAI